MPALRSGLSRSPDTPDNWRGAAVSAFRTAASACRNDGTWLNDVAKALSEHARQLEAAENMLPRSSRQVTPIKDNRLGRSEEHTSELQSLMRISYAVFCLKKKKKYNTIHRTKHVTHTEHNYT